MDQLTKDKFSERPLDREKILKDNDVKETSSDKEKRFGLPSNRCFANKHGNKDIMEYDSIIQFEKTINENVKSDPNTILREQQDREYRECLELDEKVKVKEVTTKETFEELSLQYLEKNDLLFTNK